MILAKRIDRIVDATKWPAAILTTLSIPLIGYAIGLWIRRFSNFPIYNLFFIAGVFTVVYLCRTAIVQSGLLNRVVELERDITQTLLAFLMLHPVVGYRKRPETRGTRVRWLGRGNWVMLASPYFVPTATILLWLLSWLLPLAAFRSFALGFGISYHVAAVINQCFLGTNELRRLGRRFCWWFLPGANLFVIGVTYAFALDGFNGAWQFVTSDCTELVRLLIEAWPSDQASGVTTPK